MLLQPERVIAAAVECLVADSAKVAHTRQRCRSRSFRVGLGLFLLSLASPAFALGFRGLIGLGGLLGLGRLFRFVGLVLFIGHQSLPIASPQRRQTRLFSPSSVDLIPT